MRNPNLTRIVGVICVVALTVGILFATHLRDEQSAIQLQEVTLVDAEPEESIWGKMVPKSAAQLRNERRLALQTELELLIEGIAGIEKAKVLLSLNESQGLGHRFVPPRACVTITPTSTTRLTRNEIATISQLIASGVRGLLVEDVTVVDNRDGLIHTGDELKVTPPKLTNETIRVAVVKTLGLRVATVRVDMVSPSDGDLFIPWIDNKRPRIRVTLPQSWISTRAQQVGNVQIVMDTITHMIHSVAAGSLVELVIVQDQPIAASPPIGAERSSKQWAMVVGLIAVLLSGFSTGRRKREVENPPAKALRISEEAAFILSLPHDDARLAIEALRGSRRRFVLQAITDSDAVPLVEVPTRKSTELVQCG
jgi:hypothetical protein